MVTIYCDNEECEGQLMDSIEDDSRDEWYEEKYECCKCNKVKIHRIEYDQNGLVTSDKIYNDE